MIRFLRPWGLDLRNADSSTIRGLIIHSFPYAQIGMDGTDGANIKGNWLGLKPDGSLSERKSTEDRMLGLSLINSAQATSSAVPARDKNVISGNEIGIVAMDRGASANLIWGNYIGATTDGLRPPPQHRDRHPAHRAREPRRPRHGARTGSSATWSLGDRTGSLRHQHPRRQEDRDQRQLRRRQRRRHAGVADRRAARPRHRHLRPRLARHRRSAAPARPSSTSSSGNVLGIEVNGGSDRTTIAGNRVGTDFHGTTAAPNTYGVAVVADGLGEAPADMTVTENTIAGSSQFGMFVTGDVQRAKVTDNRSAPTSTGSRSWRTGSVSRPVVPAAAASRRTTSRSARATSSRATAPTACEMLDGERAVVRGNRIGVGADDKPLGNGSAGVLVHGDGTLVDDNTVSANAQGVVVNDLADDVHVRHNRVGTAPNGEPSTVDFGNSGVGVLVMGNAWRTRVGGSGNGDANLISGNGRGVQVQDGARETTIRQNVIGLDTTATKPIPNDVGVSLAGGTSTVVGGALGIDGRNLIARNLDAGDPHQRRQAVGDHGQLHHRQPGSGRAGRHPRRRRGDRPARRRRAVALRRRHLPRHALQPDRAQRRTPACSSGPPAPGSPCAATACAPTRGSTSTSTGPARPPTTPRTPTPGPTRRPRSRSSRRASSSRAGSSAGSTAPTRARR